MNSKFSIKELEKLSGIKAHTLRIWEQRYGILKPERTDTNIRWYSNDELKLLLNITLLNKHGLKISKIAELSYSQIVKEVKKIVQSNSSEDDQISELIISMVDINEKKFEQIITDNINKKGLVFTFEKILYPFLIKIGVLWQTGSINPAQEHFISNLIRQKLFAAIDKIKAPNLDNKKKFVLFLPEKELHEISLLFYSYILKQRGFEVIYLGQSLPLNDLSKVVEIKNPDFLMSVFTNSLKNPNHFMEQLSQLFPKVKILISGAQIIQKSSPKFSNIKFFNSLEDLNKIL